MRLETGDEVTIDGTEYVFVGYVDGDLLFEPTPRLFADHQRFLSPEEVEEVVDR